MVWRIDPEGSDPSCSGRVKAFRRVVPAYPARLLSNDSLMRMGSGNERFVADGSPAAAGPEPRRERLRLQRPSTTATSPALSGGRQALEEPGQRKLRTWIPAQLPDCIEKALDVRIIGDGP